MTLLVGSFDPQPVPDMTDNVFGGTLNPAQFSRTVHNNCRTKQVYRSTERRVSRTLVAFRINVRKKYWSDRRTDGRTDGQAAGGYLK